MSRFERAAELPVSAEEAFAWHARPDAFERLSPPWRRIEILEPAPALADGTRLVFRFRQGPIWIRWVAEHRDVVPGRRFRDVQIEGPFAAWRHTHDFEPREGGCVLRDTIEYRLPLGWLGRFLGGPLVRRDLERLFDFRHRRTREDLERGLEMS